MSIKLAERDNDKPHPHEKQLHVRITEADIQAMSMAEYMDFISKETLRLRGVIADLYPARTRFAQLNEAEYTKLLLLIGIELP